MRTKQGEMQMAIYETIKTINGNTVTRIKSSIFYWLAIISFILGAYLLYEGILIGGFLSLTLAPFLILYPPIRFLFGGRDSVAAVVTTAVVEEVLKAKIGDASSDKRKKR